MEDREEPKVYIIDSTNRATLQTSYISFSKFEKTMINFYLNEAGIFQTEIGTGNTSHEFNYINANIELNSNGSLKPIEMTVWIRSLKRDSDIFLKYLKAKKAVIAVPCFKPALMAKFGKDWHLEMATDEVIEVATSLSKNGVEFVISLEHASQVDEADLRSFLHRLRDIKAKRFRYCDNIGCETPEITKKRAKFMVSETGKPIEILCYNDLGLAVANAVSGAIGVVEEGFPAYIVTTVCGMGPKAGICDLLSTVLIFRKAKGLKEKNLLDPRVDLSKMGRLTSYVLLSAGKEPSDNQVGIGKMVYPHASGFHVDGLRRELSHYELLDRDELGRGRTEAIEIGRLITTGDYSDIKGFRNIYGNLEIEFKSEEATKKILDLVRYANVLNQRPLIEDELKFIARHPDTVAQLMTVIP